MIIFFSQFFDQGWILLIFDGAVEQLATNYLPKCFIFHGIGTEHCYVVSSRSIVDVDESVRIYIMGLGHF